MAADWIWRCSIPSPQWPVFWLGYKSSSSTNADLVICYYCTQEWSWKEPYLPQAIAYYTLFQKLWKPLKLRILQKQEGVMLGYKRIAFWAVHFLILQWWLNIGRRELDWPPKLQRLEFHQAVVSIWLCSILDIYDLTELGLWTLWMG